MITNRQTVNNVEAIVAKKIGMVVDLLGKRQKENGKHCPKSGQNEFSKECSTKFQ